MPEVDAITPEAMENYIGVKIMIYHGDTVAPGSVRLRKRNVQGNTIGIDIGNPVPDTKTYEVEFEDGSMRTYSINLIEESLYAQCDEEGHKYLLFDQYWITRQTGMPYPWQIKMWFYVGEVRNGKPQRLSLVCPM